MSNVVPFRRPQVAPVRAGCDVVAVADDLFEVLDKLQSLVGRATLTGRPALEIERTAQHLLDAVSAVEQAIDCIGEGGDVTTA